MGDIRRYTLAEVGKAHGKVLTMVLSENKLPKIRELVLLLHKENRSIKRIVKTVKEMYPGFPIDENKVRGIINKDKDWQF